jgi:hypothetical protein
MKKIILAITLLLLVLMCAYTYTADNNLAGDEDVPRVFFKSGEITRELNYSISSSTLYSSYKVQT